MRMMRMVTVAIAVVVAVMIVLPVRPAASVGHTRIHTYFVAKLFGLIHRLVKRGRCHKYSASDRPATLENESERCMRYMFNPIAGEIMRMASEIS